MPLAAGVFPKKKKSALIAAYHANFPRLRIFSASPSEKNIFQKINVNEFSRLDPAGFFVFYKNTRLFKAGFLLCCLF
ncbi:hypothetical protein A2303_03460 [Candidatus Falkowbacteria bacterium RIFOXYB2_FULL_47_14]|uniref:Uncharacterized protein n=1 Tax=Candidatus Falkowbacteria bacterium RIFOXYA2_FULL_47_19 TaxID=1797994 RepID=A0A1F5SHR4_9BACT|nr:MAG: hypothetical protein A2227_03010 [Candidatus Falkowbacteria bacterium RIFOXYA2_FULL_47_19]OGF36715.1 MAG: hypothetical protein A2468_02765 [Candidatus Falkowbacteria bacterium RIFOXYC2_FULL_46_15]OGF42458.1 MAG: hypothetical protein A2303_03460 [Candidatus Falkowbacteria bacterium RIFOXYB2_FULL_47_14]